MILIYLKEKQDADDELPNPQGGESLYRQICNTKSPEKLK